jgi:hypothetical protein
MSKKHNTTHNRIKSNYHTRLEDRGLQNTPRQSDFRLSDGKRSDQKR